MPLYRCNHFEYLFLSSDDQNFLKRVGGTLASLVPPSGAATAQTKWKMPSKMNRHCLSTRVQHVVDGWLDSCFQKGWRLVHHSISSLWESTINNIVGIVVVIVVVLVLVLSVVAVAPVMGFQGWHQLLQPPPSTMPPSPPTPQPPTPQPPRAPILHHHLHHHLEQPQQSTNHCCHCCCCDCWGCCFALCFLAEVDCFSPAPAPVVEFCENSTIKQNSQFPCLPVLFWVSWTYCWCCSWWTAIWKFLCFESCGVFFFRKTRQYLITTTLLRGVFWFLLYFVLWAQEMKCSTYLLCIFRFSVESSLFVLFPQGFHT